jgi:hypothetical protein
VKKVTSSYDARLRELTITHNGVRETWKVSWVRFVSVVYLTPPDDGPTLVCVRGSLLNHCPCSEYRRGGCRHLRACLKEGLL